MYMGKIYVLNFQNYLHILSYLSLIFHIFQPKNSIDFKAHLHTFCTDEKLYENTFYS